MLYKLSLELYRIFRDYLFELFIRGWRRQDITWHGALLIYKLHLRKTALPRYSLELAAAPSPSGLHTPPNSTTSPIRILWCIQFQKEMFMHQLTFTLGTIVEKHALGTLVPHTYDRPYTAAIASYIAMHYCAQTVFHFRLTFVDFDVGKCHFFLQTLEYFGNDQF